MSTTTFNQRRKDPEPADLRANVHESVGDILDRIETKQARDSRKMKQLEERVANLEALLSQGSRSG